MPELFKTLLALTSTLIGVLNLSVATLDFLKNIFQNKNATLYLFFGFSIQFSVMFLYVFQHRDCLIFFEWKMKKVSANV